MKKFLAMLLVCVMSFSLFAGDEEHPLSTIEGKNIDLKTNDHAFAGSIKDFVAWGFVDESTFSSELSMRKYGQTIKAKFQKIDGVLQGVISHVVEEGTPAVETHVVFKGIVQEEREIAFEFNGEAIRVKVIPDAFKDGHFINPTYIATVNGEEISYKLNGEACYGFSLHMAMIIIGAYIH